MKVQVAKWDNSTAVRFPKQVVDDLQLHPGSHLDLLVEGNEIGLVSARKSASQRLDEFVAEARRLGPGHEPETVDWGPDRGSEIIDDEYSRGEMTLEDLLRDRDDPGR